MNIKSLEMIKYFLALGQFFDMYFTDKNTLVFYTKLNAYQSRSKFITMVMELTEMYKRDRERLVHPFTHERGSLLAHIFGELKFL